MAPVSTAAAAVAAPKAVAIAKPRSGANDNRSSPAQRLIAPETDVERFYKERIETQDGSSLTATSLYEDYCAWCEDQQKEPLALPTFGREFGELGVQKARIAGRVRYIGIALKSAGELEEDKKLTALSTQAA
jgi:phage/plasmid-associated DNA primase